MPANRITALGGALTAVVGALVTLLGAIQDDTAKAVVLSVALVVVGAIVVVFLIGHQKHEARVARPAWPTFTTGTNAMVNVSPTPITYTTDVPAADPADVEPGDPDGLPHLPVTHDVPADRDDSVHKEG